MKRILSRPRVIALAALLSFGIIAAALCTISATSERLGNDPATIQAIAEIVATGAKVERGLEPDRILVPLFIFEIAPEFLHRPFITMRTETYVDLQRDQINAENLSRIRNIKGLAGLTLFDGHLTGAWIDFLRGTCTNAVVEIGNCTGASDDAQAFIAELNEMQAAVVAQLAPTSIAPPTAQVSSAAEENIPITEAADNIDE